jgi:DNA-binding MarR family transcriptional regulator
VSATAEDLAGRVGLAPDGPSETPAPDQALAPHERLARSFKAAMAAVRRLRGRETHIPGRLSNAQYGLLFSLAGGSRRSARELAEAADLTPATVTQMLEALEAAGLVQRLRSDADRRIVLTSLTARGRRVVEQHRARVEPRWRAALAEFSDEQLLSAAAVLDRLARYFDEWEA